MASVRAIIKSVLSNNLPFYHVYVITCKCHRGGSMAIDQVEKLQTFYPDNLKEGLCYANYVALAFKSNRDLLT